MSELPTPPNPPTTPHVTRALARIESAKAEVDADAVFAWVLDTLGHEHLYRYAERQRITLHEMCDSTEAPLARTIVIWAADGSGFALVPHGQDPRATLRRLREQVAERDEETRLTADFQASVAAGHVEDIDAWHARTSPEGR
jgi:hypothetical protein